MDNRRFSRILFSHNAKLSFDGVDYPTILLDLSLKGALVQRPANWHDSTGKIVLLQFTLDDSELALAMEVTVAHQHEDCLGLHINKLDIESASHLRRLLELNLGDAELLSRELSELTNTIPA